MSLGIVGNCQYSALIDAQAKVVWLCWPRLDSGSVFGSLIDEEKGGYFSILPGERDFSSQQEYVRNTNILRTEFTTQRGKFEVMDFAPRYSLQETRFRPTQLIRCVRPISGESSIQVDCTPRYMYGAVTPDVRWESHHVEFEGFPEPLRLSTNAPLAYLREKRSFFLMKPIYLALSWGTPMETPLEETCEAYFNKTKKYWRLWVKHCALPSVYQEEVIRSALVLKLHQYEDTGAIIAATTTSLPEADGSTRNWDYRFCWLRDAYFSLSALGRLGKFEEMEEFVAYLRNIIARTKPERLQPVYGISGESELTEIILETVSGYRGNQPVRIGNQAYQHIQNDIYGEMILAISPLFLDERFVGDMAPMHLIEILVDFIGKMLEVPDAGPWEFRGKEQVHSFSVLMHYLGAKKAEQIALRHDRSDLAEKASAIAKRSAQILDEECWDQEARCYRQAPNTSHLDASLFAIINLPYQFPTLRHAHEHLQALEKGLVDEKGLVYRYLHADDFGKPTTTFTVCGLWYVEALARLGYLEKARKTFDFYMGLRNHLGLLSEDIDPVTLQQWGNFPQTYSHVGIINAAFEIDRRAQSTLASNELPGDTK